MRQVGREVDEFAPRFTLTFSTSFEELVSLGMLKKWGPNTTRYLVAEFVTGVLGDVVYPFVKSVVSSVATGDSPDTLPAPDFDLFPDNTAMV